MDGRFTGDTPHALTWTIDDAMQRSSHALVDDGRVWIVDPVGWEPALERVEALGEAVAVIQLLDRHGRDGEAVARRLGVPFLPLPGALHNTPFRVVRLTQRRWWREVGIWWNAKRTLVVPEAVGTAPSFAVGEGRVGVHPMLRLTPPERLLDHQPEDLLVGHGPPVVGGATEAIRTAVEHSRSDVPQLLKKLPGMLRGSG